MITIQEADNLISVAVFGEFTLADFKEFEEQVSTNPEAIRRWTCFLIGATCWTIRWTSHGRISNSSASTAMISDRIAIITDNQWRAWAAWVFNLFVAADIRVFSNYVDANAWLEG